MKAAVSSTKRAEIGQKGAGMGPEPVITESSSYMDMLRAYNWYNYFYNDDDSKEFVVTYYKKTLGKSPAAVQRVPSHELHNIGWNCRILSNGGTLPADVAARTSTKLDSLIEQYKSNEATKTATVVDYTIAKANRYIADLEEHLDAFYLDDSYKFDVKEWRASNNVNARIAQLISQHYSDLIEDVLSADNSEAYDHLTPQKKKKYVAFLRSIVDVSVDHAPPTKGSSGSRVDHEPKPKKVNTSKMQYHQDSPRTPNDIVGKTVVYTYNTKYNRLHCFVALPGGLSVKGTSITNYDEKLSMSTKLGKESDKIVAKIKASSNPEKVFNSIPLGRKPSNQRFTEHVLIIKCI